MKSAISPIVGEFPTTRLRRTRQDVWCRDLVAETQLSIKDLILPLFVCAEGAPREICSMPGVFRYSLQEIVDVCGEAFDLGIAAVALFPNTPSELKCEAGREALNPNNLACEATRLIKKALPDLGVIVDVALDPYTTHGHDGLVREGYVANDETLNPLNQIAVSLARAGVDMVAPSDMMDGRIGTIRKALDYAGFQRTRILSYSVKYASAFYGPFRDAVGSKACLGTADKETYQMDPANSREALREAAQDIMEGADILMVKPGLPYLDIIYRLKETFAIPIFAYQTSGEYGMLKLASEQGLIEYRKALIETLIAFKRAGASAILSYAAMDAAKILKKG